MNRTKIVVTLAVLLFLAACTRQSTKTPLPTTPAAVTPIAEQPTPISHPGLPLPTERGAFFAGSGTCTTCHRNMVDESGTDVSNDSYWRSTMMANAARDPYWQANVKKETLSNPAYQAEIEDKCATCHMPMARFSLAAQGGEGKIFDDGFLNSGNELHNLAMDGVSCTVCHQIQETNLGQPDSFSGHFQIDTARPSGERLIYGPYPPTMVRIMQRGSGFIPTQGSQLKRSELCATCHTLYTPAIDVDTGEIVGEFPEQTPYLEWLNSDYHETQTCQDCHMPQAQGGVVLSITGGKPRSPFSKHVFVGGNVYMQNILKRFGEELQVTASTEQFDATIARTLEQLQNRTASLSVKQARLSGSTLIVDVAIRSQVGHKFPSGFPSRRSWVHLVVRDAGGQVVFESGAFNQDGSIVGNDNDNDPTRYEPHYQRITSPDQVQIYEVIMKNSRGDVTTTLLQGTGYAKDNRILPAGFDKSTVPSDVTVRGKAVEDGNFVGGGDTIQYTADLGEARAPFSVTAELLYQTVGYRWAQNLRQQEAPEISRFLNYYKSVSNAPVVIASETIEVR